MQTKTKSRFTSTPLLALDIKKATIITKNYGCSSSSTSISVWPFGDYVHVIKDTWLRNIYRSINSTRWAFESTHYLNQPTLSSLPITIQRLKIAQTKIMRTALFKTIKEHFFIPLSFKITEIIHELKRYDDTNDFVTIRAFATAKPCERTSKCMKCSRRYRCITQRAK